MGLRRIRRWSRSHRVVLSLAVGLVVILGVVLVVAGVFSARKSPPRPSWVAAWALPTSSSVDQPFQDQTVRTVMRLSFGGSRVRIRLSNVSGTQPVVLADAHVGIAGMGAAIRGPSVALTFHGSSTVTVPAGQSVLSDPAELTVRALEKLDVSVYAPSATGPSTGEEDDLATYWVASGDHAADPTAAAFPGPGMPGGHIMTGVDVYAPNDGLIVAFGDSITAGYQTPGLGWPYWLANRLVALAAHGGPRYSVIDMGITGNDLSADRMDFGMSGVSRLKTDALDQSGFKMLLLMEGINDIGDAPGTPSPVSAAQLEAAYANIIAQVRRVHAHVLISPMTPAGDAAAPTSIGPVYSSPGAIAERLAVNTWITGQSGAFSPAFDFPPVLANPQDPNELVPKFDSGDHLHPNVAGHQALAASIDITRLTQIMDG